MKLLFQALLTLAPLLFLYIVAWGIADWRRSQDELDKAIDDVVKNIEAQQLLIADQQALIVKLEKQIDEFAGHLLASATGGQPQ